ncbi:hypothetical protein [[Mycobacterium] nativiensis]|uniref:Uncharacterized protein n=1 Tax=[Mycobacterium] nativiensis TaxID=2855503 RepID=A0ABU5Y6Z7_9MYCO|nr:hypothetical protein [Mycolicibacter sp. MYC340]MEB3034775.1 hypothetical protein [Mycolicibacter sp. MYC340]
MSADTAEPRRIVVDVAGPFVLAFDKRNGYGIEVDGQRVRIEHLRAAVAAYDAAIGGEVDE